LRKLLASLITVSLLLAGCGGGGGSTAATTSSGSGSSGSGTGTGTGTGSGTGTGNSTAYTVVNAVVDAGPIALAAANESAVNILYVKVTLCVPGSTSNCQTIDHIQVDTGSQGLRILSTVVNPALLSALQPVSLNGGGAQLAECTQFVDGYSWGPLVTADLHIGGADSATSGESAPDIPVQIVGTTSYAVPSACANNSVNATAENTVAQFGANGIIGLGLFDQDCGPACSSNSGNGLYYSCVSGGTCTGVQVPIASQMVNPVYKLAAHNGVTDNNGVVIVMPAIGAAGAPTVTGTVVFGISTQSNNTLASGATVLTTDPNQGYVVTSLLSASQTDPTSYFDSGSNAVYFNDTAIPTCTQTVANGFFCPSAAQSLSANVTGQNGQMAAVNFAVDSALTLFNSNPSYAAFGTLAGGAGQSGTGTFAWGLPFYYGRTVYTAMENVDAGGTNGPYFAF
jgi:Protein of unknown function (DUF3443)